MLPNHTSIYASYAMKLDVYSQKTIQNADTKELIKSWQYVKTIECLAKSIISSGVRSPSNQVDISKVFSIEEVIKIRTRDKLSRKWKVSNIRDEYNNILWEEAEIPGSPSTVFEVVGSTPIVDATGRLIEFETTLQRSEVQNGFS
jgi:hypothetical protein